MDAHKEFVSGADTDAHAVIAQAAVIVDIVQERNKVLLQHAHLPLRASGKGSFAVGRVTNHCAAAVPVYIATI